MLCLATCSDEHCMVDDGKDDDESTALVGEPQEPIIEPSWHRFVVIGLFVLVSCLGGFSIDLVQVWYETLAVTHREP